MIRVMITGSKGQLGAAFVDRLSGHAEVFGPAAQRGLVRPASDDDQSVFGQPAQRL